MIFPSSNLTIYLIEYASIYKATIYTLSLLALLLSAAKITEENKPPITSNTSTDFISNLINIANQNQPGW